MSEELGNGPKFVDAINLPEAPASANARITSPAGVQWQITIRDFSVNGLIKKCGHMESHLLNNGWTVAGPHPPSAPTNGTNGTNGDGNVCPMHGKAKESKRGGLFCPAKIANDDGSGKPVYCTWKSN